MAGDDLVPGASRPGIDPQGDDVCRTCGSAVRPTNRGFCPTCGADVRIGRGRDAYRASVSGTNAQEVQRVAAHLVDAEQRRRGEIEQRRRSRLSSPWATGSFYLVVVVVVIGILLVAGSVAPWWTLPIIILGGVLILTVVGALQMRQDDRLSEEGFLQLMRDALLRLPLLVKGGTKSDSPNDEPPPN